MKQLRMFTILAVLAIVALCFTTCAQAQFSSGGNQYRVMNFTDWSTNAAPQSQTNRVSDIQVAYPLAFECIGVLPVSAVVTISRIVGQQYSNTWTSSGWQRVTYGGTKTTICTVTNDANGYSYATNVLSIPIVQGDLLVRDSTTATNGTIRFFTTGW